MEVALDLAWICVDRSGADAGSMPPSPCCVTPEKCEALLPSLSYRARLAGHQPLTSGAAEEARDLQPPNAAGKPVMALLVLKLLSLWAKAADVLLISLCSNMLDVDSTEMTLSPTSKCMHALKHSAGSDLCVMSAAGTYTLHGMHTTA